MTNKDIKVNDRVIVKVDKKISADQKISGTVISIDDKVCLFMLDPKYKNVKWGFELNNKSIKDYKLNKSLINTRVGAVPPILVSSKFDPDFNGVISKKEFSTMTRAT